MFKSQAAAKSEAGQAHMPAEPWSIHFGDYDRATVEAEREDLADHDVRYRNMKIITTTSDQSSIDAAVAKLNGKTG